MLAAVFQNTATVLPACPFHPNFKRKSMREISLPQLAAKEIVTGYKARFVHTEHMTLAYWDVTAGSVLPEHAHLHEQVCSVLEGSFELTVNGQPMVLQPGKLVVIPGHTRHSGRALTDCKLLDVFYPVREDYKTIANES